MKVRIFFGTTAMAVAMLVALTVTASAQNDSRVDRIRQTGTITLGHPEASIPFSFLGNDEKPIGYSVEICQHIAKMVGKKLGIENIQVRYSPTTSATRLPLIGNGTIDLECGNTTNKEERKKFVAFSPTTFVAQVVLGARKDRGVDVNDLSSFKGKKITATSGGQTFKVVATLNAKNDLGITMIGAPDSSLAFIMMTSGRADGVVSDDGLLYAAVATSKNPEDFVVGSKGLEFAPYGIVEPKDDPKFKELVDSAVKSMMADGTIAKLYEKYFDSPIPPRGVNLHYPMSDALKRAIAHPTDSSDPADYRP